MITDTTLNKTITLRNSKQMPVIGLGVWETPKGEATENAVLWALETGYRLIDTAAIYKNEEEVGNAIKQSGILREELFITTKLWITDQGYDSTLVAMEKSLSRLKLDYVDLYLIHWPFMNWNKRDINDDNKRPETWAAMEEIYLRGKAKEIGVANYAVEFLEEMKSYTEIPPAVNQVEFHPFWFRKDLMDYCHSNNIVVEDYSPLSRGKKLQDERITQIAVNHGKSNAQVLLRWGLQHGNVVIPKSTHKERIKENFDVFDFELNEEDMRRLDNLNENYSALF
jgi:diketogulonate reductase-like aldo/keto reductase